MKGNQSRPPPGESVQDLLDDPIVQLVMRRDGLTREDVLSVIAEARRSLFGLAQARCGASSRADKVIRLAA